MENPKVTVSLITYNHAPFIAQAIESVLAQETDFPFELVIGEDDSSDGTREIVQQYAARFPDKIRLHLHARANNIAYAGRPTGRRNFVHNLRDARAAYIALLDGDDYWCDPRKLQLQADYLDAHPECSTCFCLSRNIDERGEPLPTAPVLDPVRTSYTLAQFLQGEFRPRLSTTMYRRGLFADFPDWFFTLPAGDYPLHILNGQHGNFAPINQEMVAYRIHGGGVWTQGFHDEDFFRNAPPAAQMRRLRVMIELQTLALNYLGPEYAPILQPPLAARTRLWIDLLSATADWPAMRQAVRELLRDRSWPGRYPFLWILRSLVVSHFPFLARRRSAPSG